ncbi:MAG: hypothetical protein AAFO85_14215 [Cyanobacteria bacterium J06598_4]
MRTQSVLVCKADTGATHRLRGSHAAQPRRADRRQTTGTLCVRAFVPLSLKGYRKHKQTS